MKITKIETLPKTKIGKLEVTKLILGGNPISAVSHGGTERTRAMLDYFTMKNTIKLFHDCEKAGINTCCSRADEWISRIWHHYRKEGGKMLWFCQTAPERKDQFYNIESAKSWGADAIYIQGGSVETEFENKNHDKILALIKHGKSLGFTVGVAGHIPENHFWIHKENWPVDFHMVCLYKLRGLRGKLTGSDQEEKFVHEDRLVALKTIQQIKKPCLAYKIMGAGRYNPREAYKQTFEHIKPSDGVVVGMFPPDTKDIVSENVALLKEFSR